jgi:hypothetical protein
MIWLPIIFTQMLIIQVRAIIRCRKYGCLQEVVGRVPKTVIGKYHGGTLAAYRHVKDTWQWLVHRWRARVLEKSASLERERKRLCAFFVRARIRPLIWFIAQSDNTRRRQASDIILISELQCRSIFYRYSHNPLCYAADYLLNKKYILSRRIIEWGAIHYQHCSLVDRKVEGGGGGGPRGRRRKQAIRPTPCMLPCCGRLERT